jgi:hypothetical protein
MVGNSVVCSLCKREGPLWLYFSTCFRLTPAMLRTTPAAKSLTASLRLCSSLCSSPAPLPSSLPRTATPTQLNTIHHGPPCRNQDCSGQSTSHLPSEHSPLSLPRSSANACSPRLPSSYVTSVSVLPPLPRPVLLADSPECGERAEERFRPVMYSYDQVIATAEKMVCTFTLPATSADFARRPRSRPLPSSRFRLL